MKASDTRGCRRGWVEAAIAVIAGALLSACAAQRPAVAPEGPHDTRIHALLINGGGAPPGNYQSHALHIQQMLDLLDAAGISRQRIGVFNSDGSDPAADQVLKEDSEIEQRWRVAGTRLDSKLISPLRFINSQYENVELRPANQAALSEWFESYGAKLGVGDTLLLYVTDHGNLNRKDASNNTITLWGPKEDLSVVELTEMLARLDPKVRVVALMSQCFSGSFGGIIAAHADGLRPSGNVCGYFASTADRPAYGCYPENRGRQNVGHSFRFIQALANSGSFSDSHDRVLIDDDTPDVPLRTSDLFLETVLRRAAQAANRPFEELVDELLAEAWQNKSEWEPELRRLDRIGQTYGYFSPRSLAEIAGPDNALPSVANQMRNVSDAWRGTLTDYNRAQLDHFLTSRPDWASRLNAKLLETMSDSDRAAAAPALIQDLGAFSAATPDVENRLNVLHDNSVASAATSYRMSVRLGIVERMRYQLVAIAGRVYLRRRQQQGESAESEDYAKLRQCEDLRIAPQPKLEYALTPPEPFPPMETDISAGTASLPAWMGIRFQNIREPLQEKHKLSKGAASVVAVFPDSPAQRAGLEVGDIVIGAPGKPFADPGEVRWTTMLAPIGKPRTLEILREGERRTLALRPEHFPLSWPALPGPPKAGDVAPPLKVVAYRGHVPALRGSGPHLLFFWATWCLPCKASLPELIEFERQTGTPVIAITDEPRESLDRFFAANPPEFPPNIAIDEYRKTFVGFAVSGTPTYVLVDSEGKVLSYHTGYRQETGLPIVGWKKHAAAGSSAPEAANPEAADPKAVKPGSN